MLCFLEKGFECLGYLLPHKITTHNETDSNGKKYSLHNQSNYVL